MEEADLIYVYYGAVPAYTAYQPLPEIRTVYGKWIRHLPAEEKVAAVRAGIHDPARVWLIFSHYSTEEYNVLVQGLITEDGYRLQDEFLAQNAGIALLEK